MMKESKYFMTAAFAEVNVSFLCPVKVSKIRSETETAAEVLRCR